MQKSKAEHVFGRIEEEASKNNDHDEETNEVPAEERVSVLSAALKVHEENVTQLWVGEGAIGISFSSFIHLNMPNEMIPEGGSIVVTDVDPLGPAATFGIQVSIFNNQHNIGNL